MSHIGILTDNKPHNSQKHESFLFDAHRDEASLR